MSTPNENQTARPEVKGDSRKKSIKTSVRGRTKGLVYPNISAGICDFCGHPPYACPKCKTKIKQLPMNKDGECLFPTHCTNNQCMIELPKEAIDPLKFCKHYSEISDELACIYCKERKALFYRKHIVRGVEQPDGSVQLIIVCSDINCRISFQKEYAPEQKVS